MNKSIARHGYCSRIPTICLIATATFNGVTFSNTSAHAQENTLGKSSQQILAMGNKKWTDYYASKHKYTNRSMADAQLVFARVLGQDNDKKIASLPLAKRTRVQDIRKAAREYATSLMNVESHNGGTSYIPTRAGIGSDVELMVRELLSTSAISAKNAISNVRKHGNATVSSMTRLEYFVRQVPSDSQNNPSDTVKLIADVDRAKAAYNEIRTVLATAPDTETSTVAAFLALRAHDALISAEFQAGLTAKPAMRPTQADSRLTPKPVKSFARLTPGYYIVVRGKRVTRGVLGPYETHSEAVSNLDAYTERMMFKGWTQNKWVNGDGDKKVFYYGRKVYGEPQDTSEAQIFLAEPPRKVSR